MIRSELDVLLDRIEDPALRDDLRVQIDRLKQRRSFGLVFEQHIPERVRLPQHPIRIGSQVVSRDDPDSPTYEVVAIEDGLATLTLSRDADGAYVPRGEHAVGERERMALDALVVITEFGEPVLPGFRYLGAVERGGDKPYHVVINGENHHALEALRFTHAGKVDCIYIDPPYNSGARDWKYNNDYVDETDAYRHSKWLAFMERRLKLAWTLLSPSGVALISIDDGEFSRLQLLCGQTFGWAGARATFVCRTEGNIDNQARVKPNHEYVLAFARSREFPVARGVIDLNVSPESKLHTPTIRNSVVKNGPKNPVSEVQLPAGFPAAFETGVIPARTDAWPHYSEELVVMDGRLTHPALAVSGWANAALLRRYIALDFVPVLDSKGQETRFELTETGAIDNVKSRTGSRGHVVTVLFNLGSTEVAGNQLKALGVRFPYPKPIPLISYLLEVFTPVDGVVLDFFAGSGTTAHASFLDNRQDGGRRQSIMITNNEVSAGEAAKLKDRGRRPGDPEWEALGIFESVTRPRVTAAISGRTPDGRPIKGDYKFSDEFPMADGFEENAAFLELRYLDADDVDLGHSYDDIAPLLWLRAGASGPIARRTDDAGKLIAYAWTGRYGVLFDEDRWRAFVSACPETARAAFIVTDSPTTFAGIVAELPSELDTVRLYDSYLSMFLPERDRH